MKDYAYYNGVFTPYDAASVPLSDKSIFFGEAVYDLMIGRQGSVYQLDLHLDRLTENAQLIGLSDLPTKAELIEIINELLTISGADTFSLYLQLSASCRRRNHLGDVSKTNILVTVTDYSLPERLEFINAILIQDIRHGICNVKTTNLLLSVMSLKEAVDKGAEIAIFRKNDEVTECSHANISIYREGELVLHPFDSDILPGITQKNIITACDRLGIPTKIRKFGIKELFESDFALISSTSKFVRACTKIDSLKLKGANLNVAESIFNSLRKDFTEKTNEKSVN